MKNNISKKSQNILKRLRKKANDIKGSRMPSLKQISSLLTELEIEHRLDETSETKWSTMFHARDILKLILNKKIIEKKKKRKSMIKNRLEMYINNLRDSINSVYGFSSRLKKNERERQKLRDMDKLDIDKMDYLLLEWDRLDLEIELEEAKQQKIKSLILNIENYV